MVMATIRMAAPTIRDAGPESPKIDSAREYSPMNDMVPHPRGYDKIPPMPKTVIIGTAGHIDHGKSSLVRALTGTNPDRLKEEQDRGTNGSSGRWWPGRRESTSSCSSSPRTRG